MHKLIDMPGAAGSRPRGNVAAALTAACLCLGVAGCLNTPEAYSIPTATAYQVEDTVYTHAVRFAPNTVAYTPIERSRIGDFVNGVRPEPDDTIVLMASGPLANARMQIVAEDLGAQGVTVAASQEILTGGETVTVTVRREVYLPTACRPAAVQGFTPNALMPPLGCATATNLARMVADPQDLIRGRETGPAEGPTGVGAVNRYRTDAIKPPVAAATN